MKLTLIAGALAGFLATSCATRQQPVAVAPGVPVPEVVAPRAQVAPVFVPPELPSFSERIRIEDRAVREASGLAGSLRHDGLLWVLNDSGNDPVLYATGADGSAHGRVRLSGTTNRDWEDLASFRHRGRAYLLVADVGDNLKSHRSVRLHFLPEPDPPGSGQTRALSPQASASFVYEDKPHNCEGVAVSPAEDAIYLATKGEGARGLYRLPLGAVLRGGHHVATRIGEVELEVPPGAMGLGKLARHAKLGQVVTGLDLSSSGRHAAWLSYTHAYLTPGVTRCAATDQSAVSYPDLQQAEGIALPEWDHAVWVASEGSPGTLVRLPLP